MANEKRISIAIVVISVLVPSIVASLFSFSIPVNSNFDFTFFPKFHAILNSLTAILISIGLYMVKQKKVKQHRAAMLGAFLLSTLFLCSYITYHSMTDSTKFGGEGTIRTIYFVILISHILLSAAILPLILFTFSKALNGQIEQHRKLAKWTFPLWLYVAISGVLVYLLISPYY